MLWNVRPGHLCSIKCNSAQRRRSVEGAKAMSLSELAEGEGFAFVKGF
jgi:hypothetical protein